MRQGRWLAWGMVLLGLGCGDDGRPDATATSAEASGPSSTGANDNGTAATTTAGGTAPATSDASATMSTSGPGTSSVTGPSTTMDPSSSSTGEPARCPATSECFFLDGDFHTASEATPTFDMDLAFDGDVFSAMELELDVVVGEWHPVEPDGMYNLFWLHRGPEGVGPWAGGVLGYVNLRGPNRNRIRSRHDLDVIDLAESKTFNVEGVAPNPGDMLHLFYRYDAVGGSVAVELSDQNGMMWSGTDTPTTNTIANNIQNTFYFYAGNSTDIELEGPEVPSLGWVYSNLRIEFIP